MIIVFSGTGNTRYVATLLAGELGDEDIRELTPDELRHPEKFSVEASGRIIWAFPTYSWGVPPVVAEVMRRAVISGPAAVAPHYMLTTCGDDMAYADRQWRRIMRARKLEARGAYAVVMPNTYVCMKGFDVDSPELAHAKIEAAAVRVGQIARSITGAGDDILVRGSFPWIKTAVIYPWFKRFAMSPGPFHATQGCIGCGKCARECPMDNISMKKEAGTSVPAWGKACALCLRCYHVCPVHSVAYGKATLTKGQYRDMLR